MTKEKIIPLVNRGRTPGVGKNLYRIRDDPDIKSCTIAVHEIGYGIWQYTCWSKRCSGPVGVAWVNVIGGTKTRAEINHCYVQPFYRRFGVMSRILTEILKDADIVDTVTGSDEGGMAFLLANGFRHDRRLNIWWRGKR